jgi:hypothetical protein
MKKKEQFFEILLKRTLDKHAFCRGKVLNIFYNLMMENYIPNTLYKELLRVTISRIKDVTATVRKSSLKLLTGIVHVFAGIFTNNGKFLPKAKVR